MSWKRGDQLTSDSLNRKTVEIINEIKKKNLGGNPSNSIGIFKAVNYTETELNEGNIVYIDDGIIDEERKCIKLQKITGAEHYDKIGIVQNYMDVLDTGFVKTNGISTAIVQINDEDHKYCKIVDDEIYLETQLEKTNIQLLFNTGNDSGDNKICVIRLEDAHAQIIWSCLEFADITDETVNIAQINDQSGDIVEDSEITVNKMLGQFIKEGDRVIPIKTNDGLIQYIPEAGWRIDENTTELTLGSNEVAETDKFDPLTEETQNGNVTVDILTRSYLDKSAHILYEFTRKFYIDKSGNIYKIDPAVRHTVDELQDCTTV